MIKLFIIPVLLLFPFICFSQQTKDVLLFVELEKLDSNDSLEYFSVALFNKSDSVLCFLYPNKFNMSTSICLHLCQTNSSHNGLEYDFKNAACDDLMDAAIPLYEGLCILPFQAKIFTISVNKTSLSKDVIIDFFYKKDFSYSKFIKEKKNRGWYRKYKLLNKGIRLN
jgi:hypothetical protein